MPLNQTRFVDENNLSDDEFKCFFSMLKESLRNYLLIAIEYLVKMVTNTLVKRIC